MNRKIHYYAMHKQENDCQIKK